MGFIISYYLYLAKEDNVSRKDAKNAKEENIINLITFKH